MGFLILGTHCTTLFSTCCLYARLFLHEEARLSYFLPLNIFTESRFSFHSSGHTGAGMSVEANSARDEEEDRESL